MHIWAGMTWTTAVPLTRWRWWKLWRRSIPWLTETSRYENPKLNSTQLKLETLLRSPVRIELKKANSCIVGGAEGRDRGESLQACGAAFQDDWHRWGRQPHPDWISQGRWWMVMRSWIWSWICRAASRTTFWWRSLPRLSPPANPRLPTRLPITSAAVAGSYSSIPQPQINGSLLLVGRALIS